MNLLHKYYILFVGLLKRSQSVHVLLLFFSFGSVYCQDRETDSLYSAYKNNKLHDTIRLDALQNLGWTFVRDNPDSAIVLTKILLLEAKKLKLEKIEANAYSNLSVFHKNKSEYPIALEYALKGLEMRKKLGALKAIGVSLNGLGNIYSKMNNFPKAIECFIEYIKIGENLGSDEIIGNANNNIGNIYFRLKNNRQALHHYQKSLVYKVKIGNPDFIASANSNIAAVYSGLGMKDSCLLYNKKALTIFEKKGNRAALIGCFQLIAEVQFADKQYDSSLATYNKALKIAREVGSRTDECIVLSNSAEIYLKLGKVPEAEKSGLLALKISESINDALLIKDSYAELHKIYIAKKDHKKALNAYTRFVVLRDSLLGVESQKAVLEQSYQHEYERKSLADSLSRVEEKRVSDVKLQGEKNLRFLLYGGLAVCLLFAAFMFNRYKITQKQKKIIEAKEKETQQQKGIIEEKNKEIVDSINYAKKIQYALLAHESLLKKNLQEHFILFQPKDIVSGDFYWATEFKNKFYLAVCDSTGHGVPGAFMSLLNISFLNEAINEQAIENPSLVFDHVRKRLIENVSQDEQKDGMDGILISFDKKTNKVSYAAANNGPLLVRDKSIVDLEYNKMPVGKGIKSDPFSCWEFEPQKGDVLYLFTDGYTDQFGGPKGKKFKYKRLIEKLVEISKNVLSAQKKEIENDFVSWKGALEQVDDVLVIGIRF